MHFRHCQKHSCSSGRTNCGVHNTMMSHEQYLSQVRSSDQAHLEESDISPMILRSLVAGRSFARLPFLCPPHPIMDLPCEWAQFLYTCAERGLEDSAFILIATWYRQGPAMTQQFNVNHGHPDGDLLTSILAYEWFLECQKTCSNKYGDWKTSAMLEWKACSRVGLIHHVLVAIHKSALVLKHTFDEHRHAYAFPEVPRRKFGSPGYSTLLLHSVWTSFFDRCLIKLPTGKCCGSDVFSFLTLDWTTRIQSTVPMTRDPHKVQGHVVDIHPSQGFWCQEHLLLTRQLVSP